VSALTAAVGYQPAGLDLRGRRCRGSFHAVVTGAPVRFGFLTRCVGEALCGVAPLGDCPAALFPAVVSCAACLAIAAREHVEITRGAS
jgi:hypothetical protein